MHVGMPQDWKICKCNAWPNLVNSFFLRHFKKVRLAKSSGVQKYNIPRLADKGEVNYLMSTYGMLKRFISEYQIFVRTNMAGVGPYLSELTRSSRRREAQLPRQIWPPLSKHETLRLQRGFLRYELCCRVNTVPYRDAHIIIKTDLEGPFVRPISSYIHRWEEEEIRCVWAYVHQQYLILVRDTVAEFRCDVRRLSNMARSAHDNEVTLAPGIVPGRDNDYFEYWAYNMSCYGLPLLQQLLRSGLSDQRRFLKNTTFGRSAEYERFQFLKDENCLRHYAPRRPRPIAPRSGQDPGPIYMHMTKHLETQFNTTNDREQDQRAEKGLKEHGWIFWENEARLKRFVELERFTTQSFRIFSCYSPPEPHAGFAAELFDIWEGFPEQTMYVTKEDRQALSAKHAVKAPTRKGDQFFYERLSVISDQPSKESLPVFQEICSGMPAAGSP